MLCAHTVRRLKPGAFDDFAKAFDFEDGGPPPGWVRFHLQRGLADENEVVTFGFFEVTLEELERSQKRPATRAAVRRSISWSTPVVANGVHEIVVIRTAEAASTH
jgi:hypothetical protein